MVRSIAPTLPGPIDPTTPHDYERTRLARFDGGFRSSEEPENLAPNELSDVNNLFWYDGQLLVDNGYAPFAPVIPDMPQVAYQVFYPDGTSQLILLALGTLYVLFQGAVSSQWQYVNWSGPATLTANAIAAGDTGFNVTSPAAVALANPSGQQFTVQVTLSNGLFWNPVVTGVSGSRLTTATQCPAPGANANAAVVIQYKPVTVGNAVGVGVNTVNVATIQGMVIGSTRIGVTLRDGTQWQFVLSNIQGAPGNYTLVSETTTCPAPGAAVGAPVAVAPMLNGRLSVQACLAAFPANGWLIISNGVDPVFYFYNGVAAQLPGLPDGTTCDAMCVAHQQLLIGNTIENGMDFPQRIRASDQADPTGWVPGQNGIAAIYNLVDTEDFILSLNLLGPWLIVYRETTIMRGTYLGLPNQTWFWEYMIFGEGIISQGAVAEIGENHFIVGQQGIYTYAGGYDLTSVGDNIFAQILSAKGILNPVAKSTLFVQYIEDQDECWIFFPTGQNTLPDTMIRCSLEKHAWYFRSFADKFVSAGIYLPLQTIEWVSALGTWAQNTAAWDSRVFLLNAPTIILSAPLADRTFIYDYTSDGDNGVPLQWDMTMKDIGTGNDIRRWDSLTLFGAGNGITISYALDPTTDPRMPGQTQTFTPMTTSDGKPFVLNFGAGKSRQRVTFDAASTFIRVRLSGSDPTFFLEYAEMWHSFESEY